MSNWEEQIRGEILAARPPGPTPNWEKMAGLLDTSASQQRRRRWLLAACFGGLLLLGAGIAFGPQQQLERQYAVQIRPADTAPAQVPADSDLKQNSAPVTQPAPRVAPLSPVPIQAHEQLAMIAAPATPVLPDYSPSTPTLSTTQLLSSLPAQQISLQAQPEAGPVVISTTPSRPKGQWQLGLRTSLHNVAASSSKTAEGNVILESGYGAQPGGWLEVAYAFPNGTEIGGAVGGQAVWQPVVQEFGDESGTFADIWGKAIGGLLQARQYFFRGSRVQPFLQGQAGYARESLNHTEFVYEEPSQPSNDPHSFWQFRKDLPEEAVISSTNIRRNAFTASAGAGLQLQVSDHIGVYASSVAGYRWITGQTQLTAGNGLVWEHALGLRLSM